MGLRPGSAGTPKAEAAGLRVMGPSEAAAWADVVMVLTPDELQGGPLTPSTCTATSARAPHSPSRTGSRGALPGDRAGGPTSTCS